MLSVWIYLVVVLLLVGTLVLALFRARHLLGIGPLFLFVGANQYLQTVLGSTVYFPIGAEVWVSPGSAVLFSSSLLAVLVVFLYESVPTTRTLIYGILLANVSLTILVFVTDWGLERLPFWNVLDVPVALFRFDAWVFLVGTGVLMADCVLVVVFHEYLRYRFPEGSLILRVVGTLAAVLVFDALLFTLLVFGGRPEATRVLTGQLLSKLGAAIVFGTTLWAYVRFVEPSGASPGGLREAKDVFSILTYRQRYEQAQRRLEESEAESRAKSRFLAQMSHELRTPLNAIIGFSHALQTRDDVVAASERMGYLSRIEQNGRHLLGLINGILDFSRLEAGRFEVEPREVAVDEVVDRAIAMLAEEARRRSLELSKGAGSTGVRAHVDPDRLLQVLLNLVGNSLKFTDSGAVTVTIVCDRARGNGARYISVRDSGRGIPAERLESIFLPFEQVSDGAARGFEGTGLGLAISQELCELMGCTLRVESRPGEGTTFFVDLPAPQGEA